MGEWSDEASEASDAGEGEEEVGERGERAEGGDDGEGFDAEAVGLDDGFGWDEGGAGAPIAWEGVAVRLMWFATRRRGGFEKTKNKRRAREESGKGRMADGVRREVWRGLAQGEREEGKAGDDKEWQGQKWRARKGVGSFG